MAKRRTPPLFEVLSSPDRRPGPGGLLGQTRVQVPVPPPEPKPTQQEAPEPARARGIRLTISSISLGLSALICIVAVVWFFAFHQGRDSKMKEIGPYLGETNKPSTSSPDPTSPLNPVGSSANGEQRGASPPDSDQNEPAATSGDPRKPGINYLHVVILNWKDADRAAAYLTKNGVPAAVVRAPKGVDVETARSNNKPLLVIALDGVPSAQYSSSAAARSQLVEKVRKIGKKWQSEEKGPSDFGDPGWVLFK